jgi:vacuolar-type H+-ATPase subunit E/Vma4
MQTLTIKELPMKPLKWIGIFLLCQLAVGGAIPALSADEARQAYDKMVEEATREADEYVQEKQSQHKAAATKSQGKQDAALEKRVQAESERITTEMDSVSKRGIGSGFTQGMKDNLLQQLQDKLDRLTSDPEAYFGRQ